MSSGGPDWTMYGVIAAGAALLVKMFDRGLAWASNHWQRMGKGAQSDATHTSQLKDHENRIRTLEDQRSVITSLHQDMEWTKASLKRIERKLDERTGA